MKRVVYGILLLVALLATENASAQLKSSYFMEGAYFRTELNPALTPTRGYIALPLISGYSGGLYSNIDIKDNILIRELISNGQNSPISLANIPQTSKTSYTGKINVLGAGFYDRRGMFWNFGINLNLESNMITSKELYSLMLNTPEGTNAIDKFDFDTNAYLDTYIGTAFSIGKHVTLGVRAKFLVGIQNANIDIESFDIVDGSINTITGKVCAWSPDMDRNGTYYDDEFSYILHHLTSYGAAIDLGAEVRLLSNRLKVSAALTDLGFIHWSDTSGIVIDYEKYMEDEDFDTWSDYTTSLTAKLNIGAEYNFCNNYLAVGLLSHTRFYRSSAASELTVSLNVRPTNWVTLTASHTLLNGNKPGVFGAAINIHPCGINIFAGMDYLGTKYVETNLYPFQLFTSEVEFMMPRNAKSFNFYFGLGFNLARPKHVRMAENK